jgi:hypothetical protein
MQSFALAALAGLAAATPMTSMDYKFINYVAEHGKSYGTHEEYMFRMEQFAIKEAEIASHNATVSSYRLAHNKFSDYTEASTRSSSATRRPLPAPRSPSTLRPPTPCPPSPPVSTGLTLAP